MRRLSKFLAVAVVACAIGATVLPQAAFGLSASLTAAHTALFPVFSTWYVTGRLYNPAIAPVVDVMLTVTFKNASNVTIGSQQCPAGVHVFDDATYTWYRQQVNPPAGTTSCVVTAVGTLVSSHAHKAQILPLPTPTDLGVARTYAGSVVNPNAFESITGLLVFGEEWLEPPQYYDAITDANHVASVIGPGSAHDYTAYAMQLSSPQISPALTHLWFEWVDYDPTPVYRFYNKRNNSHFFTVSQAERDDVIAHLSSTYNYEGEAYQFNSASPSNMRPLYRFFNKKKGSHFYTVNQAERDDVIAHLSSTYNYEGEAYKVSTYPWYARPVYRFYNRKNGTHFYTADATEKSYVQTNLSGTYNYEGVGFYLAY